MVVSITIKLIVVTSGITGLKNRVTPFLIRLNAIIKSSIAITIDANVSYFLWP